MTYQQKFTHEQYRHHLTRGDRGKGRDWQASCCGKSTVGKGGPYPTAEEAKLAAKKLCGNHPAQTDQKEGNHD